MDDRQFNSILDYFHLSFKGYKKVRKGVKKRLVRHMQKLQCPTVKAYLNKISNRPELCHECRLILTVSISRFFRDRMVWKTISADMLPFFVQTGQDTVYAWSAGCARGEEPYSLKILWEKAKALGLKRPCLNLLASDINPDYLAAALKGTYGKTSVKEVSELDRYTFFDVRKKQFSVKPILKKDIHWKQIDLCHTLPEQQFDLIFLRNNILTYLGEKERSTVFKFIVRQLKPGGFLVKGAHEVLPEIGVTFSKAFGQDCILQLTG
ncbi:MAG: methyltransferase domain-containing protein [Desulfobacterales bacterium]|nr:methyltransferase domain-containing protein [Desulfobacterales bacterium]